VTTGDDPQEAARRREAADDEHAALVARVRDDIEAARRRVRDAWAQYQERAAEEHRHEAVALPPVLTALLGLVT
jgi:hypothetical protein